MDGLIILDQAKIFKDTQNLTPSQAYSLLEQGSFEPLPEAVKSFGLSDATYWVALKMENTIYDKLFLEFQYEQLAYVTCYLFGDNQLLHVSYNGNAVPLKERAVEHFFVRFALLPSEQPQTYLFKITSNRPLLIAMHIGTKSELDYDKLLTMLSIVLFMGCLLLLLLFNVLLYGLFKSRAYFYYILYLVSFLLFILYLHNYIFLLIQTHLWVYTLIKIVSLQGFHIALLLFTLACLEIRRFSAFLVHVTHLLSVFCFLAFLALSMCGTYPIVSVIAVFVVPLYCFGLSVYACWKRVPFARLYGIGLIGFCIGALLFWLMQMGYIQMMAIGKNILLLGSLWEMILFAVILLFKIKSIKTEYSVMKFSMHESEQEHLHASKYITVGRNIGNVAHQWKQPLNALGAILTHMKGSLLLEQKIRKNHLVKSLDMSFDILKYLSETIDTFYNFLLKPHPQKTHFYVLEALASIQKILAFSFNNSGITLRIQTDVNCCMVGNLNEFIQVILTILLNAQEQFQTHATTDATIEISIDERDDVCIITLQDNAGGITIEPIERIFDLHVSSKGTGAGVGLFLCKSIIEKRFEGKIDVFNQKNGACFKIMIPLKEPPKG